MIVVLTMITVPAIIMKKKKKKQTSPLLIVCSLIQRLNLALLQLLYLISKLITQRAQERVSYSIDPPSSHDQGFTPPINSISLVYDYNYEEDEDEEAGSPPTHSMFFNLKA
jgi:inner membrane protein involved in colicin E2 resistance